MTIRSSGGDIQFGVRITADNKVFIDGVQASTKEVQKLGEGLKQVTRDAEGTAKSQESLTGAVVKGSIAAEVLTETVKAAVGVYREMREVTREAQQAQATFEAVMRATGNTARLSYGHVSELANSMQRFAGFDDAAVMRAAAALATFGNVSQEKFSRTIQLAGDLAKVFGGDLQTRTVQLAKALEDPARSLGALERVFGHMDEATRKSIVSMAEFGDIAGAGDAILKEVSDRVGGAAVDSFRGLERQITGTKNAWEDLLKAIGGKVFDAESRDAGFLENTLRALTSAINDNRTAWQKWNVIAGNAFIGGFFDLAGQAELDAAGAATHAGRSRPAAPNPFAGIQLPDITKQVEQGMKAWESETRNFNKTFGELLDRLRGDGVGVTRNFYAQLQLLERGFRAGKIPLDEYRALVEVLVKQQPFWTKEVQASQAAQREYEASVEALNRTMGEHLKSVTESADREEEANRTRGLSRSAIEALTIARLEDRLEVMRSVEGADANVQALELEIAARRRLRDAYASGEQDLAQQGAMQRSLQEQARTWGQIADVAGGFFSDLVMNGRDAFRSLGDSLKQFAADLIALFARRWVLNLAAGGSLLGSAGQALAGGIGSDTLAGSAINWLSSGWSAYRGGAGLYSSFFGGAGSASPTGWATIGAPGYAAETGGSTFGAGLGTAAWVAAIVAAVYANHQLFNAGWRRDNQDSTADLWNRLGPLPGFDSDRLHRALGFNDYWASMLSGSSLNARLFGHGPTHADAYGVRGAVTGSGFDAMTWQDYSRRGGVFRSDDRWTETGAISADQSTFFGQLFAGVSNITGTFGRLLGVDPGAALAGYSRAFDLQLSEDGEALSPERLNELFGDLLGSVLQEQVATLLEAGGDSKLAEYVRSLKGSGAEVAQTIAELAGAMQGLAALDAAGLDIHALMAWQREGETIGQTFQRVAGQFAAFDDAFMTEAQKIERAQRAVTATFGELGLAIPENSQAFYDLVHGLDLSTAAGRSMFEALMKIAPAFQTVEGAALSAVAAFNSIAGDLSPSFGRQNARSELEAAVRSWMDLSPANSSGWTVESTIGNIASLVASGNIGQALTYAQSLGGNAVNVLNQMLAAYGRWNRTLGESATTINSFTGAIAGTAGLTPLQIYTMGAPGRQSISDYLDALFLRPDRTTLDSNQQLGLAGDTFWDAFAAAQGGDLTALAKLPQLADTYLGIARDVYGSGTGYVDILRAVTDALAGVADVPGYNDRIVAANEGMLAEMKSFNVGLDKVAELLNRIADQGPRDADMVAEATLMIGQQVANSIENALSPLGVR